MAASDSRENRVELLQGTLDMLIFANSPVGVAAWTWHRPGDPAEFVRFAANRARFFVSGAASSGGSGPDLVGMEEFGLKPAGKVLLADHGGKKATTN